MYSQRSPRVPHCNPSAQRTLGQLCETMRPGCVRVSAMGTADAKGGGVSADRARRGGGKEGTARAAYHWGVDVLACAHAQSPYLWKGCGWGVSTAQGEEIPTERGGEFTSRHMRRRADPRPRLYETKPCRTRRQLSLGKTPARRSKRRFGILWIYRPLYSVKQNLCRVCRGSGGWTRGGTMWRVCREASCGTVSPSPPLTSSQSLLLVPLSTIYWTAFLDFILLAGESGLRRRRGLRLWLRLKLRLLTPRRMARPRPFHPNADIPSADA